MSTEIELKFRLEPKYVPNVKQLPLLKIFSIAGSITQNLYSIYYDTPELALSKHRIALRTRKTGDKWLQTIKSGGSIQAGLHQHHEWEYPITGEKPDFLHIPDPSIKAFFTDESIRRSLQPIFVTDFQRTTYLLEPANNFKLEFCLDEGKIIAGQRTHPICEIELELKSGKTLQLLRFSEKLQEHCLFPLTPENKNKAMRGYALVTQKQ